MRNMLLNETNINEKGEAALGKWLRKEGKGQNKKRRYLLARKIF